MTVDENKLAETLQAKYDFYFQEVREHPESARLLVSLADVCLQLSKRREALLYYKKALALDPSNEQVSRLLQSNFSADELKGVELFQPVIPFWRQPGKLIGYPFKKHGLYTLIFAAFTGAACESVPLVGDLMILIFIMPLLYPFLFAVLQSSCRGEREIPDWPSFADLWEHYVRPDLMFLISSGVAFFPIVVYFIISENLHIRPAFLVPVGLVTGALYLPMSLLACAVSEKLLVPFWFRTVLSGIWKVRAGYLVFLAGAAAAMFLYWLLARVMPYSVFFLGLALFWLLTIYFSILLMRMLGNTYAVNRDRLKWRQ